MAKYQVPENPTGMIIDGIMASEAIDSSGEVFSVTGADISSFLDGTAHVNWEHRGHDEAEIPGAEIVGKILFAKKIFKESDCENDRQREYWYEVKLPYIYGVARLYDGAGHEGSRAIAAIIRDSHANNEPVAIGWSIEGSTLKRVDNILSSTVCRRVAITVKPCNKTALLGVLDDPNAPKGFVKDASKVDLVGMVDKTEFPSVFQRLGGHEMEYGLSTMKAMVAGNYNAAPGTINNGAALQVEDRNLRASAKAALRDWDRVTPFKDFLKARMPDVSDEFIDHFTDLVESHHLKMKKTEEALMDLRKAGKTPKKPQPAPEASSSLTIQGKPVPTASFNVKGPSFNPDTGVLTTKGGLFQASTPDSPHPNLAAHVAGKDIAGEFQKEMAEGRPHHMRAMQSWMKANQAFTSGEVPEGLVSHAVAFALMSPGIKVPMQESMYGHFVDALHNQGLQSPSRDKWDATIKDWLSRNRSGMPNHSRAHFEAMEQNLNARSAVRSKSGSYIGYSKPSKVIEYLGEYLKNHHDQVVDTIRNSKGNAQLAARKLTEVRGVAPKLARYLLGMMGGGNVIVPDTHFIRHYFGARPDAPGGQSGSSPDTEAIDHLKKTLLSSTASHDILEGIDKHYFKNHASVKSVLNDPELGPYFKGREEQALFPAFWKHWNSIAGHERRIGIPSNSAYNEGTDHTPFWDAVNPMLKSEAYEPDLHSSTAMQHHRWVEKHGHVHALDLFWRYLAPRLIANDAKRQQAEIHKAEALSVELLAGLNFVVEDLTKSDDPEEKYAVPYLGNKVIPGRTNGGRSILHIDDQDRVHTVPFGKEHNYSPEDLRVDYTGHRNNSNDTENFRNAVATPPKILGKSLKPTSEHHVGQFNTSPESQELIRNFTFGKRGPNMAEDGSRGVHNYWSKLDNGKHVYVKGQANKGRDEVRNEGIYYSLARNFWGMGAHVPTVAVVRHPQTRQEHAIIEHLPGEHVNDDNWTEEHAKIPQHQIEKASIMNYVMGNADRHERNYLLHPNEKDGTNNLVLIDHGLMGSPAGIVDMYPPTYAIGRRDTPLTPETKQWLQNLDPNELNSQMARLEDHRGPQMATKIKKIKELAQQPNARLVDLLHKRNFSQEGFVDV
jgi:hypothetical protein